MNIILFVTVTVGLIAFCWIKVSRLPSSPMALGLQSYTNASAVVGITNLSIHEFHYILMVERKIGGKWPKDLKPGTVIPSNQFGTLRPGQLTNLTIPVMVYVPPYPWRISVYYSRPPVPPSSMRLKATAWALKFGMRKLAHTLLAGDSQQIQASTPEMEQWEK